MEKLEKMEVKQNLVIVESNAKAKTIEKYLQSAKELRPYGTFQVVASLGHVVDLPPKEIGVDTDSWNINYVSIATRHEIIQKIKKLAKQSNMIYLAADPDREGEAIAKNLYDVLKLRPINTKRVTFHEITQRAVVEAILNPREIDEHLVDAQETRRILDRIVGYKLSPLLWRRFTSSGLSAGRVQSVALRIAVDREKEIKAFQHESIWTVEGLFTMGDTMGTAGETEVLTTLDGTPLTDKKEVERLMKELARKGKNTEWNAVFKARESKQNPSAPFTTSTLQQEASSRHHMNAKTTMQLAQALYEAGHITYMRTDSTTISEDATKDIHTYIQKQFGNNYITSRVFKTKVVNAQEAHECIRPTNIDTISKDIPISERITPRHVMLYDLIWRRVVASQMPSAIYLELKTMITADPVEMPVLHSRAFVGTARVLIDRGYLRVWQPDVEEQPEIAKTLLEKAKGEGATAQAKEFQAKGDVTRPPSLFHEPSLIKALEKAGIGRPSTYATILDKIFSKGYVIHGTDPSTTHSIVHYKANMEIQKVVVEESTVTVGSKEKDRIVPTSLGTRVVDYLEEVAPDTMDIGFTATMETKLDHISNGEIEKKQMLNEFYDEFMSWIEKALDTQKEKRKELEKNKEKDTGKDAGDSEETEKRPRNILERIGKDADIVQTKYGPALYIPSEKRFLSITPLMEWKGKTMDMIDMADVNFLKRLPFTISCQSGDQENDPEKQPYEIAMGRYGLYVKQKDKNKSIDKNIWDKIYDGTITYDEIEAAIIQIPRKQGQWKGKWQKSGQGAAVPRKSSQKKTAS